MMGAVADGALQAGGEVVGVIPAIFANPTLMHNGLTRLEIVDTMHTRKARLVDISDAFIALPGGYGTFEELFEVLDLGADRLAPQTGRPAQCRALL